MNEIEKGAQIFRFKKFAVYHGSGSMKVGVDGVLIGAWGAIEGGLGLDIGCGCGLIGLMTAQRNPDCRIEMIDIHPASIEETERNIAISPWPDRLNAKLVNAIDFSEEDNNRERFDFIISNPPFFKAGIDQPTTPRERARHEGELSTEKLMEISCKLLRPGGRLSMITTCENSETLMTHGELRAEKICHVADRPGKKPKRIMLTLIKTGETPLSRPKEETLYLRDTNGEYSDDYRKLTGEFYLNF